MIDHLLSFPDEAAAEAALPSYWMPASDDGPGAWRGDVCIPGVIAYAVTGTETVTDAETGRQYQREVRELFPGWFVVIALPAVERALRDLPGGACWRITDRRQAAIDGRKFVLWWARPAESLATFRTEPSFAGDEVPQRMRAAPAPTTTVRIREDWSKTVLATGAQR